MARASIADVPEETEGVKWEDMTPQQRAAARAVLDRQLLELAGLEETREGEDGMGR